MIYSRKVHSPQTLATHFDSLDPYYRKLWGEYIHHGYWKSGKEPVQTALEQLVEMLADKGKVESNSRVCDIGCGYGASSRYFAKKRGAQVTAITYSKTQWQYSRTHDPESSNPRYLFADFLKTALQPNSFDAVIAIETLEAMQDKPLFFAEAARILRPGGKFVASTWFIKESPSKWETVHLLEPICEERHYPAIGSKNEYLEMMEKAGFHEINFEDLTTSVEKTWSIIAYRLTKAILTDKSVRDLLRNQNIPDRIFALTIYRIWLAYKFKSLRYGLFTATK